MKENIKEFLKKNISKILLIFILIIGSFIRVYNIGEMPNGLNIDEASSGYDAFSILKYGVDRNGNSFPVVLYAWGSGQSVLYSIIMIPFVFLGGLTELTIRLPMAIIGSISILIMYDLLKNMFENKKIALVGAFFFAICPWHVMKSRWGMECNLFPDMILLAVYLITLGIKKKKVVIQILSFIILGISSYSYATSYLFLPVFVIGVLGYFIYKKEISVKMAIIYLGIVFVISIPLIIYLIINTFDLNQVSIFGITIPRMKINRYEEISTVFSGNLFENCVDNLLSLIRLLILQYDELNWNALPKFGMYYSISIVFFIIGIYASIKKYKTNKYNQIMNIWMISSMIVGAFCIINVNRINIVIIPCVYYIILGLYEVFEKYKTMIACILIIYIVLFVGFWRTYKKQDFNKYYTFNSGLEEVVQYCENLNYEDVYCLYSFKEPFIYFMFYSQYNVNNYLNTVQYFSENGTFDNVKSFGKYKFYLPEKIEKNMIIILPKDAEFNYNVDYVRRTNINQFDIYEF